MESLSSLIVLALFIGIFYFMLIRPQKRRVAAHRSLIESVQEGDQIVTIGGMYGTVARMGDDEFELEISPGTRVRFIKSAIARRVQEDLEGDTSDATASEEQA